MYEYHITNLKNDWVELLANRGFTLAVTLTYDRPTSDTAANRDLAHLHRRVYKTLYRNRSEKSLSLAAFLEHTADGVPHWHILIEPIEPKTGETPEQAADRLAAIVTRAWRMMKNTPYSDAGIDTQHIYDRAGIVRYCLKTADYAKNFDFVILDYMSNAAIAA